MLIKKVNSTFESLDKARGLVTDWNDRLSKTVRDILLNEETQEFLRDLFTSSDGNIMTLLGKFIELTTVTFLSNNNAHYLNNFNCLQLSSLAGYLNSQAELQQDAATKQDLERRIKAISIKINRRYSNANENKSNK